MVLQCVRHYPPHYSDEMLHGAMLHYWTDVLIGRLFCGVRSFQILIDSIDIPSDRYERVNQCWIVQPAQKIRTGKTRTFDSPNHNYYGWDI